MSMIPVTIVISEVTLSASRKAGFNISSDGETYRQERSSRTVAPPCPADGEPDGGGTMWQAIVAIGHDVGNMTEEALRQEWYHAGC